MDDWFEQAPLFEQLNCQMRDLMNRMDAIANDRRRDGTRNADNGRMSLRSDTPDMKLHNPGVAGTFDALPDCADQIRVGGI